MVAGTGARKTNIFLKKFLTQQQITENFLDYLEEMGRGFFKETFAGQGLFTPIAAQVTFYASTAVDSFDIFVPLRGTDGLGHLLNLDASQASQIKFENENAIDYFVGLRFNRLFQETEINVRNGQVKYSFFEEAIGELAEPNSVVDDGDETLTIVVDSIFEAGVSHAGRKVKVFLKKAVNEAGAFEDVTVIFSGGFNVIETTTALGQTTVSGISTDATDYQVFAIGPTVRRNTDLSLDPNILFLGKVEGKGAGNNPDTFDTSGIVQLFGGATQQLMDSLFSFLTGGGTITWELSTETLEWTSFLKLILPHQPFDFTINPTSISNLNDGDVLFITRDFIGGTKTLTKVANGGVPNNPFSEPIALRAGDNIYFKDGALELLGDPTSAVSGRIDGVTEDILSYIGAINEADADPNYSSTNVVNQGSNLTVAISAIDSFISTLQRVSNQNKNLNLIEGGVWGPLDVTATTVDEIQRIDFSDVPEAGTWTISHEGNVTGALAFNANAAAIETALNLLASLSAVTVTGDYSAGFVITFAGADGAQNQELIILPANNLTKAETVTITPSTVVEGNGTTDEIQKLVFNLVPTAGTWALDHDGNITGALAFNADAATIQAALNGLGSLSEVVVTGNYQDGFVVTYTGADGDQDQIELLIDSNSLVSDVAVVSTPSTTTNGSAGIVELPFSADAFIRVPGLQDERNRILLAGSPINMPHDNAVAFVVINRDEGVNATIPVQIADVKEIDLKNNDIVIIANQVGNDVIVGDGSFRLTDGQSQKIDEGISLENRSLLGIDSLSQFDPDWSGKGAPERFLDPSDNALEATANLEIELDKLFGQLQIIPHESDVTKLRITGVDKIMRDGIVLSQTLQNIFMKLDGAVIRFTTGAIFESDDTTPLGIDFTPFTIPVSEYFWYGIAIVPNVITANNEITIQIRVTPASAADAVQADAPLPVIKGNKKLGAVQVQNIAGTITVDTIKQLEQGASGEDDLSNVTIDNDTGPSNVTGLVFDKLRFIAARIAFHIHRETTTQDVDEFGKIAVNYDSVADDWEVTWESDFDDSDVVFTITSGGQVQYTSGDLTGASYVGVMRIGNIKRINQ